MQAHEAGLVATRAGHHHPLQRRAKHFVGRCVRAPLTTRANESHSVVTGRRQKRTPRLQGKIHRTHLRHVALRILFLRCRRHTDVYMYASSGASCMHVKHAEERMQLQKCESTHGHAHDRAGERHPPSFCFFGMVLDALPIAQPVWLKPQAFSVLCRRAWRFHQRLPRKAGRNGFERLCHASSLVGCCIAVTGWTISFCRTSTLSEVCMVSVAWLTFRSSALIQACVGFVHLRFNFPRPCCFD